MFVPELPSEYSDFDCVVESRGQDALKYWSQGDANDNIEYLKNVKKSAFQLEIVRALTFSGSNGHIKIGKPDARAAW